MKRETDQRRMLWEKLSPEKRRLLARKLREKARSEPRAQVIQKREGTGPVPLSHAQKGLWLVHQMDLDNTAYNNQEALRLEGPLSIPAMTRGLQQIVDRHEILRTRYSVGTADPHQVIDEGVRLEPVLIDLSGIDEQEREPRLTALADRDRARPFDLACGPSLRVYMIRCDRDEHLLLISMHHITGDGVSGGILNRELHPLYRNQVLDHGEPLPPLAVQYADFACKQHEDARSGLLDRQRTYWREQLDDAPTLLELPTDRPRPPHQSFAGAVVEMTIPAEVAEGLSRLARASDATLFQTLLAAYQYLLHRYAGQDDVVTGVPVTYRYRAELAPLIGMFLNTLPIRTRFGDRPTFRELTARVRDAVFGGQANQDLAFEEMVRLLDVERDAAWNPLFQNMFLFHMIDGDPITLPGLEVTLLPRRFGTAKVDLTMTVRSEREGLHAELEYNTDLFDRATIADMASCFQHLLAEAVANPDRVSLPLTGAHVAAMGPHPTPYPRQSVLGLIEQTAGSRGERTAVCFGNERQTYRALLENAYRIARALRARGVMPGDRVGIYLERRLALPAALLGVFAAGAAYVPLDPTHPDQRRDLILDRADVDLIITGAETRARLEGRETLCLDGDRVWLEQLSSEPLERSDEPALPAYVIFTSGSTGVPKGVVVHHGAVVNFLMHMAVSPGIEPEDVLLAVTTVTFDISVLELMGPLIRGARVAIAPSETAADGAALADLLHDCGATVMQATPTTWRLLLAAGWQGGIRVLCGGEALPPDIAELLSKTGTSLHNLYGPTETTVWSTHAAITEGEPITIGSPIANTTTAVLDPFGVSVPRGVKGELFIGGEGVTRGYWRQPGLTASRFLPDPDSRHPGGRRYATGDRVSIDHTGALRYHGRLDTQIKLRGFRIELGDIEAALMSLDHVDQAVALVRTVGGDTVLIGYVCPDQGRDLEPTMLREQLRTRLPAYMIPTHLVVTAELPLTPNGKVDRKALSALSLPTGAEKSRNLVLPRTPSEELLSEIWSEVLDVDRPIGVDESFFDLGGHSLSAVRTSARIQEVFGTSCPVRTLFRTPVLEDLAAVIDAETARNVTVPAIRALPRSTTSPVYRGPASFAQERLWFMDRMEHGNVYNNTLVVKLHGALDVARMVTAFEMLTARHESLRTRFVEEDGEVVQLVDAVSSPDVGVVDLTGSPMTEVERANMTARETDRLFDLSRGPLMRVKLYRLAEDIHVMQLVVHHIITDGWSYRLLFSELSALYNSLTTGIEAKLPNREIQYADFAAWQRSWLSGEVLDAQRDYWTEALAGAPPHLALPIDYPRPAKPGLTGLNHVFSFDSETSAAFTDLCRREGITAFMAGISALAVLLARYTGSADLTIGTPSANRNHPKIEGLVGFFVNNLVLRFDIDGRMSTTDLLRQTRETTLNAFAHQDLPFERLVDALLPERDMSRSPLYQVSYSHDLLDLADVDLPLAGLDLSLMDAGKIPAKFELTLNTVLDNGRLTALLNYDKQLFAPATIERMARHYRTLLSWMVRRPEHPVSECSLTDEAERAELLAFANGPVLPLPTEPVHRRVEAVAASRPSATAVVFDDQTVHYAELIARADALSRCLLATGVRRRDVVGLCMARTGDMVAAILAVFRTGAIYLPLEPGYPRARLLFMLEDAGASHVMGDLEEAGELAKAAGLTHVPLTFPSDEVPVPASRSVSPSETAYIIYTSGSTGRPKGVLIDHGSLSASCSGLEHSYGLVPEDRVLQFANLSFDVSLGQIFATLISGATLRPRGDDLWSAEQLTDEMRDKITVAHLPTAVTRSLISQWQSRKPERLALRLLISGGEAMSPATVADWFSLGLDTIQLINSYGPTETTITSNHHRFDRSDLERTVAIGKPLANRTAVIRDRNGRRVGIGEVGELWLGGSGLSQGYSGRPALTASRFVPAATGERSYRTGDLARYRPDGSIVFLGRLDHQVQLRGFRIELGEIESALESLPGITEAVVVVRDNGEERALAAFMIGDAHSTGKETLDAELSKRLPDYMLPSDYVFLETLPLTPNGKIDRKTLSAPSAKTIEAQDRLSPTHDSVEEELLSGIWSELLNLGRPVRPTESFFELGGHSLLAMRASSRIRNVLGVAQPLQLIFEYPVLHDLANAVRAERTPHRTEPPAAVQPRLAGETVYVGPLSFAQERLWFLDRMDPGNIGYTIPMTARISGPLAVDLLSASFSVLTRRHESLRTRFREQDGMSLQFVDAASDPALTIVDLTGCACPEQTWRSLAATERARGFDLETGPLMRLSLYCLDRDDHVLQLVMHHIITDGWSIRLMMTEMAAIYRGLTTGSSFPVQPPELQYADYAAWQRNWLSGEVFDAQLSYWMENLKDAPPFLELPTDAPRPLEQTYHGSDLSFALSPETSEAILSICRRESVTPFMFGITAFAVLLARYADTTDLTIGTPVANRNHTWSEDMLGFFVNTLVLRFRLDDDPDLPTLLGRTRATALGAYAHQEIPFERLVDSSKTQRDLSRTPLFQVSYAHDTLEEMTGDLSMGDALRASLVDAENRVAKFDLTLETHFASGRFRGNVNYNTDLFTASTIERMIAHFQNLVARVCTDAATAPVSSLDFTTAEERIALLETFNETERRYGPTVTIDELIVAQARRSPDAPAILFEDRALSYRDLDERSAALAYRLHLLGAGPERPVGIALERCLDLLPALVAVLRAGSYYVPLDPELPEQRLSFVLADAGCSLVLTHSALRDRLPEAEGITRLELDCDERLWSTEGSLPARTRATSEAMYAIYTSGSTGRPKGVINSHEGLYNRLFWHQEVFALEPGERVLQKTPMSFDVSVWELFWPLITGGTCVVAPPGAHREPVCLARLIRDRAVAVLHFVPSMLAAFLEDREAVALLEGSAPRVVICSGEALSNSIRDDFFARLPETELHNLYGPTEAAIDVTRHRCRPSEPLVPIGRPIANLQTYVLDRRGRPRPTGVPGELHLAGAGLARAYQGRPALSAASFVPNPFKGEGTRLYKTGDLVRMIDDGSGGMVLDYLGRIDNQIKLRGFRIELGEIEDALQELPGVGQAIVLLVEHSNDSKLVAFLSPSNAGEQTDTAILRTRLAERLPGYMVPAAFTVLDALPVTTNGKSDRKALRALATSEALAANEDAYIAPATQEEELLCGIWSQVLGLDRAVGVNESFFALGGHSLLAIRMIAMVRKTFGIEVPIRTVFTAPTVSELTTQILARRGKLNETPWQMKDVPLIAGRRPESIPLSYSQQSLWLVDRLGGNNSAFNMVMSYLISGELSSHALLEAFTALMERHEALRTTIVEVDGTPTQVVSLEPAPITVIDLTREEAVEAELKRLTRAETQHVFDLSKGPLFRVFLCRLAPRESCLLINLHHILADESSMKIMLRELAALYRAAILGTESPLPPLPVQYPDYALWQRRSLTKDVLDAQSAYWQRQLSGAGAVRLPYDHAPSADRTSHIVRVPIALSVETSRALQTLVQREGVTQFMALETAFDFLLHFYSRQVDICVGTVLVNRNRQELQNLVGIFVNQIILRLDLSGNPSFREALARTRSVALDAYTHRDLPFETLVGNLRMEQRYDVFPLNRVQFAFETHEENEAESFPGLKMQPLGVGRQEARYDLILYLTNPEGVIRGFFELDSGLFDRATVERMSTHLRTIMEHVFTEPETELSRIVAMLEEREEDHRVQMAAKLRDSNVNKLKRFRRKLN